MTPNTLMNQSRYYHLTLSGWEFGTFVNNSGTLHEIERPSDIQYTLYVYINKESKEIMIKPEKHSVSYSLLNMLFDKFGNFPPNIANIP